MIVRSLLALFILSSNLVLSQPATTCNGAFDIYFVLDLSSSLLRDGVNHFQEETVSFVRGLVMQFTSSLQRLSFITFNREASVVVPLTDDRDEVERGLTELESAIPQSMTRLDLGLRKANQQIERIGDRRASVVILLTDGELSSFVLTRAVNEANKARGLGGTIFSVGVANFHLDQLLQIANGSNQFVFQAVTFGDLDKLVQRIIEEACIEITSAVPDVVCYNTSFEVELQGRGFANGESDDLVLCNYWFNETENFLVTPTSFSPTRLVCPSPENVTLSLEDVVTLQVSLNGGISFISSNVTITASSCTPSGVLWFFLALLLLLLLLLLWWFSRLCCASTVVTKTDEEEEKPTPPPPLSPPVVKPPTATKQWPVVDASYYGGRGAGGMHPMKVTWGGRGCTEGAIHLEKTKDSQEVGFIEKEVEISDTESDPPMERRSRSATVTSIKMCCCGLCKRNGKLSRIFTPVTAAFHRLAQRRPTNEDVKNCRFMKPNAKKTQINPSPPSRGSYFDTSR